MNFTFLDSISRLLSFGTKFIFIFPYLIYKIYVAEYVSFYPIFRHWLDSPWKGFFKDDQGTWKAEKLPETGVSHETLQRISDCISTPPKDRFNF